MTCPHFSISIRSRCNKRSGARGSAVAGAAYQSAEKLFSEYDGRTKNYSYKQPELVFSELMLPANAPPEYSDRAALWNAVEKAETRFDAQLSRGIIAALPKELPFDQSIRMVKEYCRENFVSRGMCCDIAIHDPAPPVHNPHVHIMLTMRGIDENGKWLPKSRKEYVLDENGQRIRLPMSTGGRSSRSCLEPDAELEKHLGFGGRIWTSRKASSPSTMPWSTTSLRSQETAGYVFRSRRLKPVSGRFRCSM